MSTKHPYLIFVSDPQKPAIRLEPGSYVIGRGADADIPVKDATVSRRHARLHVLLGGTSHLMDMGSRNGTRINQHMLSGTHTLQHGDQIGLGEVTLCFQTEGAMPGTRPCPEMTILDQPVQPSVHALSAARAMDEWESEKGQPSQMYRATHELVSMLVTDQPLETMIHEALVKLHDLIPAHRYAVFIGEEGEDSLKLAGSYAPTHPDSPPIRLSRTILREALLDQNAVCFVDLPTDTRFSSHDSVMLQGVYSALVAPLIDRSRVLGILYIDSTDPDHHFEPAALKTASGFGHLLAAKIVQREYFMAQRENEALESELRIAAHIQRDLLPEFLPQVDGYVIEAYQEQCRAAGGDLYDVARLADGRIAILQADVVGKGVGAALTATNLLSAFRMLRGLSGFTLEETLVKISQHLCAYTSEMQFATLFAGILDPSAHTLEYVVAGHNPPLRVKRNGATDELAAGQLPVGIDRSHTWTATTTPLEPGEHLIIYTDGILDAENPNGEQYGRDRLIECAAAAARRPPAGKTFMAALLDDMEQFTGDTPPADDLTLIVVSRG